MKFNWYVKFWIWLKFRERYVYVRILVGVMDIVSVVEVKSFKMIRGYVEKKSKLRLEIWIMLKVKGYEKEFEKVCVGVVWKVGMSCGF